MGREKTQQILMITFGVLFVGSLAAVIALAVLYEDALAQLDAKNEVPVDETTTTTAKTNPPTTAAPQTTTASAGPTPVADVTRRINCFPEQQGTDSLPWEITQVDCEKRGCTYDLDTKGNKFAPPCYMHPEQVGYQVTAVKTNDPDWYIVLTLESLTKTPVFDPPISPITFKAQIWNNQHLQIKIEDPNNQRYEVPFHSPLQKTPGTTEQTADYEVTYTMKPFSFQIKRKATGTVLFDTSMGGFVFSDRFLQLTSRLPSTNFYGLGEHEHPSLLHSFQYRTWPIFARDQGGLGEGANLYGTHPFYMVLEDNGGNAHGVFLLNSNAMEYSLIPAPGVIMRTIGGVFDLHISTGPSPNEVIQQQTAMVGRPQLPPYWSLGFHLSRYGYNSLDNMKATVDRTRAAGIPLDVIYADIDHMDTRKDFTIDPVNFAGLSEYFAEELEQNGLRSVIILDPAITNNATNYAPWDAFDGKKGWITYENGTTMLGYVWPEGFVAFPDFFLDRTKQTWMDLIVEHSKVIPFDGLWIDMNEPANFGTNEDKPWNWPAENKDPVALQCPSNKYNAPPYRTYATIFHDDRNSGRKATLSDKTLCMDAKQNDGKYYHYDVHNLYGWSQTPPTLEGLQKAYPNRRGFVLARSTFAGSGTYASHWLGDNMATWAHMHRSIIGMLEMSMFGIAHTGPDICGFMKNKGPDGKPVGTDTELCLRWMQLGAFYPYSRNHNDDASPEQDPAAMGDDVAATSRYYLRLRYEALPYVYTTFYEANQNGMTVARPVFFEFPTDPATWAIDRQFMIGSAYMIAPLLDQGKSSVTAYLPKGVWVNHADKIQLVDHCDNSGTEVEFDVNGTVALQRGGTILPAQAPSSSEKNITTQKTRLLPLKLTTVLDCNDEAMGSLFWDDGDSINTIANGEYYRAEYSAKYDNLGRLQLISAVAHTPTKPELTANLNYGLVVIFGRNLKAQTKVEVDCKDSANCPKMNCSFGTFGAKYLYCTFQGNMPAMNDFIITITF